MFFHVLPILLQDDDDDAGTELRSSCMKSQAPSDEIKESLTCIRKWQKVSRHSEFPKFSSAVRSAVLDISKSRSGLSLKPHYRMHFQVSLVFVWIEGWYVFMSLL